MAVGNVSASVPTNIANAIRHQAGVTTFSAPDDTAWSSSNTGCTYMRIDKVERAGVPDSCVPGLLPN
ncbi:MAG TPA: hypothetical protein DEV22_00040 [Collinsella sp.]|nr:hypothetical protein [Collinsella sp.]